MYYISIITIIIDFLPSEHLPFPHTLPLRYIPYVRQNLKRAYYKKSLLWHPDRWAAMSPQYMPAVQGAFELVSAAYAALSEVHVGDGGGVDDGVVMV